MATVIREKLLKANSPIKDRTFKNIRGDVFAIQIDGTLVASLSGKHNELNERYSLALVNMTSLAKDLSTSGPGLYMAIITGCDEILVNVAGDTGTVNIKEMGD